MAVLEVRRHSVRPIPGSHLSQTGVTLARQVGENMGLFDRVLTSPLPRAFDTAIAMGFAVHEQVEWLGLYSEAVGADVMYPQPFTGYLTAINRHGAASDFARALASHWQAVMRGGENVLMISHGGVVEMGAIACLQTGDVQTDFDKWNGPVGYCEGVRLIFDGARCLSGKVIRVPQP